ncbi:MAG: hypothetical protein ACHQ1G_12090 [Planctomycetota bacterium]
MRNVRNALIVLFVFAGAAAMATESGIEVLRVSGIEVLHVDTHSWGAPPGSTVHAVIDLGAGPIIVNVMPVNPMTGNAMVVFPINHPNNRVELHGPGGVLLGADWLQFD